MIKSAVVFCSASNEISPLYFSEVEILAKALVEKKIRIVYGGAKVGLMGSLADAALRRGGEVVGVIPKYLAKPGIVHENLTELIIVDDLLDRKRKMLSLADVAIAAPGGIGTIDEITEIIALKQLLEHDKAIYFHNFLDYWGPMLEYFEELHERRMITQNLSDLYQIFEGAEELVRAL
jgi:uncharacterized protein (TIGR00730 family)